MELTELHLEELSCLQYAFHRCFFPHRKHSDAIVVSFIGEYGFGCRGNPDAQFMTAIISAGLAAWEPSALIIDLRKMKYEWGNDLVHGLGAGDGIYIDAPFPTAVLTSEINREGLTSLLRDEMSKEPKEWLFDTIEDALLSLEAQMDSWTKAP